MMRVSLLLALTMAACPAGIASDCLAVGGEGVEAGEVAALLPEFRSIPPATVLGYAPAPGARRVFTSSELLRIAGRHGVELASSEDLCVERASKRLEKEELEAAMRRSLGAADAKLLISEFSRYPVPIGEITFPVNGLPASAPGGNGPALWRGYVRYSSTRKFSIWARVKVSVVGKNIVAVADLPQGRPIQADQVRVAESDTYPRTKQRLRVEQVVGRAPRRLITAGSEILPSLLEETRLVARGDTVCVEAHAGSARLTLEGRAESSGNVGEVISVRNLQTGRLFSAWVSGKGRAAVTPH
jgi:flagella basal body P-ring formation protein FlgA